MNERQIRYIKVYGERNTGTNYLVQLLKTNFQLRVLRGTVPKFIKKPASYFSLQEPVKDLFFQLTSHKNLGWKHREVDNMTRLKKNKLVPYTLFLVISKNPYSWLLSLYRRPYHFMGNVKDLDFCTFLQTKWGSIGRESRRKEYTNPIIMWNIKHQSYLDLSNLFRTYVIRYEDLVQNPQKIIFEIAKKLDIQKNPEDILNYTDSTKDNDKNFDYYKEYYGYELWRKKLSKKAITYINNDLDQHIMHALNYKFIEST